MKHGAILLLLFASADLVLAAAPARRLTRYEYDCTVRDLLGVDFQAGNDFPPDNFSYGFDNNAATLTVTPALMAKYLQAATRIARAAVEPVPPPSSPELARRSNPSRFTDITWQRRFRWDGDYDLHIAISGRADPFTLYVSVDGGEPGQLPISVDFEGRRYADTRLNIGAGLHELRVYAVRDEDRALEEASAYEAARAKKTGVEPLSRPEIRARLDASTLADFKGRTAAPYPEYVEARGPYGPVFPALPDGYSRVFSCGHAPGHHTPACLRGNLENLARRAWRRPVRQSEIDGLMRLVAAQAGSASSEQETLQREMETGIEAILVSPSFLFRIEAHPEDDFELASRLSYFLWSSMPDEHLFQAAERGDLDDPAKLSAEARRMLADPKSNALAENFAAQWLEFRNLDYIHRDPRRFPQFTGELRDAMRTETELFVEHVLHDGRTILDFLDARYSFLNQPLAQLYGIAGVTGEQFRKVDLSGTARRGILTQASILTVTAYATRTSPVLRGKWILENILNAPPPPPPANVAALRDSSAEPALTLRQQLEQHRSNPACAGCHARMDTLGFGLENFDAIGRWRSHEGTLPVDSAGTLPDGSSFANPAELAAILAKRPAAFAQGLTGKLMIYALGRGLNAEDRGAAAEISESAAKNGYRFLDLILGVVNSPQFRMVSESKHE